MPKIESYLSDTDIQGNERVLATDGNGDTVNIEVEGIAQYSKDDAQSIKSKYESNPDTNSFTDQLFNKLNSLEDSKFLGTYISLGSLISSNPLPQEGSFGYVDTGVGQNIVTYIWDDTDSSFILQTGSSTETATSIKTKYESNTNTNSFSDSYKSILDNLSANTIPYSGTLSSLNVNGALDELDGKIIEKGANIVNSSFSVNLSGNSSTGLFIFDDNITNRGIVLSTGTTTPLSNGVLYVGEEGVFANTTISEIDNPPTIPIVDAGTFSPLITKEYADANYSGGGGVGASQLSELSDVGSSDNTINNVLISDGTLFQSRVITASDISDFSSQVGSNAVVLANSSKRSYPLSDENKVSNIPADQNQVNDSKEDIIGLPVGQTSVLTRNPGGVWIWDTQYTKTNVVNDWNAIQLFIQGTIIKADSGDESWINFSVDGTGQSTFRELRASDTDITYNGVSLTGSGTGMTTDQVNRLNNSRKFQILSVSTDEPIVNSYIEVNAGLDIGKKPIITIGDGASSLLTLDNTVGVDGDTLILDKYYESSTFAIEGGTGVTLIWNDLTDTNQAATINGLTTFTKFGSLWKGSGNYTTYNNSLVNLYSNNDAADPENEANTVGSFWIGSTLDSLTSSTNFSSDGTYSLRGEQASGISNFSRMRYQRSGLTNGSYTLSYDIFIESGTGDRLEVINNATNPIYNYTGSYTTALTNQTVTFDVVDGTLDIRFHGNFGSSPTNMVMYLDNIVLTLN